MASATADIPVLETQHLRLRAPALTDFADSLALWSDPTVTRFITGKPQGKQEVWARLQRYVGHWLTIGFGYWTIESTDTGGYLGEVGFSDPRRDITPSFDGVPEMGWALAPLAQGKGLASEAAGAALAWRDVHVAHPQTICLIAPENTVSLRLAEKLGFGDAIEAVYNSGTSLVLRRATPQRG
jgi:RimJ/RimL family protein N-acetyltransferase